MQLKSIFNFEWSSIKNTNTNFAFFMEVGKILLAERRKKSVLLVQGVDF